MSYLIENEHTAKQRIIAIDDVRLSRPILNIQTRVNSGCKKHATNYTSSKKKRK